MTIIDSFFAQLGFEIDDARLKQFQTSMESGRATALALGGAIIAAGGAIALFVDRIANHLDELGDFAEKNQVGVEAIQELGHAAQLNGSSLEDVKSSIERVNKAIGEAVLGVGRGAKSFEKLGFSAKDSEGKVKTFDSLLMEVSDRMQGLSRQEQIAMAEKLGIDGNLVPMLAKGSAAIAELREEARAFGVASSEDTAVAGEFMDAMDRIKFVILGVANSIAVKLMPPIMEMLVAFRQWIMANRELIKNTIERGMRGIIAVLQFLSDWTWRVVRSITALTEWMNRLGAVTKVATIALALFVSWMAGRSLFGFIAQIASLVRWFIALDIAALVIPIAIGAIIVAFGLLIDDFINFKEGNESWIGGLAEKFPQLLGMIDALGDMAGKFVDFWLEQWNTLQGPIGELGTDLMELGRVLFEVLWPAVKLSFQGWAQLLGWLLPIVVQLVTWLVQDVTMAIKGWILIFDAVVSAASSSIAAVREYFGEILTIAGFIFSVISGVVTAVSTAISTTVAFAVSIIDAAYEKVRGLIDGVANAVGKVKSFLGFGDSTVTVEQGGARAVAPATLTTPGVAAPVSPLAQALGARPAPVGSPFGTLPSIPAFDAQAATAAPAPGAPFGANMAGARQGVLGRTDGTQAAQAAPGATNSTQVNVGGITVMSPDPARAGEAVRQELGRVNRETTRNGQSQVDI